MSDLDAYKLAQVEKAQKADRADINALKERETARDVKVDVATTAMNRLSALVGSAGLLAIGGVITFVLTGGAH